MKKPRFETLANLAHRREEEARKRLGHAEGARAEQAERLVRLEAERLAAAPGGFAMHEIYAAFWRRMGVEIAAAGTALAACEREVDAARAELVEAHREGATWDKLRERDALVIAAASERRMAKELDDFGAQRRLEG